MKYVKRIFVYIYTYNYDYVYAQHCLCFFSLSVSTLSVSTLSSPPFISKVLGSIGSCEGYQGIVLLGPPENTAYRFCKFHGRKMHGRLSFWVALNVQLIGELAVFFLQNKLQRSRWGIWNFKFIIEDRVPFHAAQRQLQPTQTTWSVAVADCQQHENLLRFVCETEFMLKSICCTHIWSPTIRESELKQFHKDNPNPITHTIHVWYIYLHLPYIYAKCR